MTEIKNKPSYTPSSSSYSSASSSASSRGHRGGNDAYGAASSSSSGQSANPQGNVDWSKVKYDFSGVDWKSVNYNVGGQAQGSDKATASSATSSPTSSGYDTTDSIQAPATTSLSSFTNKAKTSSASSSSAASTAQASASTPSAASTPVASSASSGASASSPSAASSGSTASTASAASSGTSASSATGPGVWLTNSSSTEQTYSFYNNASNGVGTANPTYTDPTATETLAPGQSVFVPLPSDFKGRVQKTDGDPNENTWATASTWAEFQLSASNDGAAHGDISYQTGFDGAATIASTDGTNQVGGTTQDLIANAPTDALAKSATGAEAIANNTNAAATAYLQANVDESKAYTGTAGTGTNDISSSNNQLAITFY